MKINIIINLVYKSDGMELSSVYWCTVPKYNFEVAVVFFSI